MIKNKIGDYKKQVNSGKVILTIFLDFEEQKEVFALENNYSKVVLYGGFSDSERKRAIIAPVNEEISDDLFEIVIIQSKFDLKFANITHRHVLGTIMSLGINRNTFGDIFVENDLITIFVSKDILDYLLKNLKEILHQPMKFKIIDHFKSSLIKEEEKTINVASMRLDAVVAKALNIGRSEAVELIESGSVLINHAECLNITKTVLENDILSIRKFGRVIIKEIIGYSKKNRLIVKISLKH